MKELNELERRLKLIRKVVDEQAEDEGLWSIPISRKQTVSEAYLQHELRRLHRVIEECWDPNANQKSAITERPES